MVRHAGRVLVHAAPSTSVAAAAADASATTAAPSTAATTTAAATSIPATYHCNHKHAMPRLQPALRCPPAFVASCAVPTNAAPRARPAAPCGSSCRWLIALPCHGSVCLPGSVCFHAVARMRSSWRGADCCRSLMSSSVPLPTVCGALDHPGASLRTSPPASVPVCPRAQCAAA